MSGLKYHNVPTVVDGITFPSKKEAKHYMTLKMLQSARMIKWFLRQVPFTLLSSFDDSDGEHILSIKYIADFLVVYPDNTIEIQDVKGIKKKKSREGTRTDEFNLKWKWMKYNFRMNPDIKMRLV